MSRVSSVSSVSRGRKLALKKIKTSQIRRFINKFTLATLGSLTALSLTGLEAAAVNIKRNFKGGVAPGNMAGGGNLINVFNAAADWWELAIQDDHTLTINFQWAPLNNFLAFASDSPLPGPPTRGFVQFDNDGSSLWFADSTPDKNEEYQVFRESQANLGGGRVNTGRVYSNPTGSAVDRFDLFSVAKHEIGHALGFFSFSPNFGDPITVTGPRPLAGTQIPTTPINGGHIDISTTLMFPYFNRGQRKILTDTDTLAIAQISKFEKVNLNLQHVPEPLTILGSATVLGVGVALKREYSKRLKKAKSKA